MKRTQRKDAVRNIRRQFISFLSILIVISLGVGIFLACRNGSLAMARKGSAAYEECRYRDVEIRGTHGIMKGDLEAVLALPGVKDAELVYAMDLIAVGGAGHTTVHVVTRTERIDRVVLEEGALPAERDECAVEADVLDELGLKIGDTLRLEEKSGGAPGHLTGQEYRITGKIVHPDHFHLGDPVAPNVLIPFAAFTGEADQIDATGMLVRVGTDAENTFSPKYRETIDQMMRSLSILGSERSEIRDAEIRAQKQSEIDDAKEKLDEGRTQLDEGREELTAGQDDLQNAKEQLAAASAQLESGEKQLGSSKEDLDRAKERLDKAKASLDAAAAQLASGRAQLDSAAAQLAEGEAQLNATKSQLDAASATLNQKQQELAAAHARLTSARTQLDEGRTQAIQKFSEFQTHLAQIWDTSWGDMPVLILDFSKRADEILKNALDQSKLSGDVRKTVEDLIHSSPKWQEMAALYDQIPDGEAAYRSGLTAYEEGLAAWNAGKAEYDAGVAQYEAGLATYNESRMQYLLKENEYSSSYQLYEANLANYNSSYAQYEEGLAKYEASKDQLESGQAEYDEKQQSYQEGAEKLAEGEKTLNEKEEELLTGEEEIADAEEKLAAMESGHWILLDRSLNASFHELDESVRTFAGIGNTFALLFILLGVLVCYATIGKIIDEQRTLVGTTKALGFHQKEILGKYLLFGSGSAVIGALAGLALSYFVLEKMIVESAGRFYRFGSGNFTKVFTVVPAILAVAISLAVACFATWIACRKLLSEPATRLMSGEIPTGSFREKPVKDGKRPRSLYSGLILRNIRSDWKRVLVTVISIAGCCTLLIIGFSLKASFDHVIARQFSEIIHYDASVEFLPERSETAETEIRDALRSAGADAMPLYGFSTITRIGTGRETAQVICGDPVKLMDFYNLKDARNGQTIQIPDGGAVIWSRLAETYDLSVGDHFSILDEAGVYRDVPVAGIYQCYAGRTIFLSKEYAEDLFGESAQTNRFAVSYGTADKEALTRDLQGVRGFYGFRSAVEEKDKYQKIADALRTVIIVMIVMAGIMAAVVLLNLLRIQINQKRRELTIMRVNGFTTRETVGYILRENVITTIVGILLGLVVGNAAARFVLMSIERVELQMIREINWQACLYSVLITILFAGIMNYLALRKIRKLKLSDVNS